MFRRRSGLMNLPAAALTITALGAAVPAGSAPPAAPPMTAASGSAPAIGGAELTYADLADLADRAPSVVHALMRKVVPVDPARAPGVRPGWVRLYVEARPMGLLAGPPLPADSLRYLVDVPLDAKGRPPRLPRLARRGVILFARTVPDRPGELQLVAPDAHVVWSAEAEARVRAILTELLASDAPGRIDSVREAIHVPGNLAGEGETQIFLGAANGEPASIAVVHQPGQAPRWSVSFSEVLAAGAEPPARETLAWYRLACFLPAMLPLSADVSATPEDRARAAADYALVRGSLGSCPRARH